MTTRRSLDAAQTPDDVHKSMTDLHESRSKNAKEADGADGVKAPAAAFDPKSYLSDYRKGKKR